MGKGEHTPSKCTFIHLINDLSHEIIKLVGITNTSLSTGTESSESYESRMGLNGH